MNSTRRTVLILLAVLAVLVSAQELTVVRLRDAVGDTIDPAERDSFHLFPNTNGFQHAVILALPGPEFHARITRAGADSAAPIFLRIMPTDLERIRFLIDNHESVAEQQRSDSAYAQALASFWHTIEDHPLRNIAGEPAVVEEAAPPEQAPAAEPMAGQEIPPPPTESAPASEPAIVPEAPLVAAESAAEVKSTAEQRALPVPPKAMPAESLQAGASGENRYNYTLHGVTCGSAAGGCIGSWTGLEYVHSVSPSDCNPGYSVYRVEPCVYWGAAIGATTLGCGVGAGLGGNMDRKVVPQQLLPYEGSSWRTGCTIGAAVPGLALGALFFILAGGSHYGKMDLFDEVENDPSGFSYVPMALTGVCLAVELATIGYRIGRSIDRRNAAKAEAQRRTLDH